MLPSAFSVSVASSWASANASVTALSPCQPRTVGGWLTVTAVWAEEDAPQPFVATAVYAVVAAGWVMSTKPAPALNVPTPGEMVTVTPVPVVSATDQEMRTNWLPPEVTEGGSAVNDVNCGAAQAATVTVIVCSTSQPPPALCATSV